MQAIDIGLGKHAALAGHRVQLHALVAHVAELFGGNAQLGVDLVDHRARAAGALVVHRRNLLLAARFRILFEDDDLGVLSAQFDHRSALGVELLYRHRNGVHFLDELGAQVPADTGAAGTRNEYAATRRLKAGDFRLKTLQEFERLFRLFGVVALIVAPHHLVGGGIHHHRLDRGGTDIETD